VDQTKAIPHETKISHYSVILHQVGCIQKWLIWFYAALLCSDFLDDVPLQVETLGNIQCDLINLLAPEFFI
jgi:hypothetical protein